VLVHSERDMIPTTSDVQLGRHKAAYAIA